MTISEAVATKVRKILKEQNMSQYKLEQITTIPHGTMNCFLNGRYKSCNLTTVFLIIQALEMAPEEFFADPIFKSTDLLVE